MGSWGRHGWPKKNEGFRLYKERGGSYLIMDPDSGNASGYSAIANALTGSEPSLASCTIARDYTYTRGCTRVQWSEVPEDWQKAIRPWLPVVPELIRGFWLVGEQPKLSAEEFLKSQFEFEFCPECGGDAQDHEVVDILSNLFALCKYPLPEGIADGDIESELQRRRGLAEKGLPIG